MPFTEDLDVLFDTSEHGTAALWLAAGSTAALSVDGVFDNGFANALGAIADSRPSFTCAEADVEGIAVNDALTVSGVAYTVVALEPDGVGVIVLRLREAA